MGLPNQEGKATALFNIRKYQKGIYGMFQILWAVVVILFVFWLLGLIFHFAGGLIHILLILAVLVLLYNLFMGSRRRT